MKHWQRVIWRSWVRASPGAHFFSSLKISLLTLLDNHHESYFQKRIPSNRIRTSDLRMSAFYTTTVLRSTNWAIKGTMITLWIFSMGLKKKETNKGGGKKKEKKRRTNTKKQKKMLAADGFDPSTSGLWAQHASTAPRCSPDCCRIMRWMLLQFVLLWKKHFLNEKKFPYEKKKRPIRDLNPWPSD